MSEITTIGLDLAKYVFQVHGIDARGSERREGDDRARRKRAGRDDRKVEIRSGASGNLHCGFRIGDKHDVQAAYWRDRTSEIA
jgi:hypothetical protein